MEHVSTEVKELLAQVEKLPVDDKRVILASIRGMLLVADANKPSTEQEATA